MFLNFQKSTNMDPPNPQLEAFPKRLARLHPLWLERCRCQVRLFCGGCGSMRRGVAWHRWRTRGSCAPTGGREWIEWITGAGERSAWTGSSHYGRKGYRRTGRWKKWSATEFGYVWLLRVEHGLRPTFSEVVARHLFNSEKILSQIYPKQPICLKMAQPNMCKMHKFVPSTPF